MVTLSRDMRDIYTRGVDDALRRVSGPSHASYTRTCEVKACRTPLRPCTAVSKATGGGVDTHLDDVGGDGASGLVAVLHVAFEIDVEELEDQIELLIRVHDVEESAWHENKAWSAIE